MNEAAERLRLFVHANANRHGMQDEKGWLSDIDLALAAERRATVERIRAPIAALLLKAWDGLVGQDEMLAVLDAILDEEAAR